MNYIKKILYKINNQVLNKFACKFLLKIRSILLNKKIVFGKDNIEIFDNSNKVIINSSHLIYVDDVLNNFDSYFSQIETKKDSGFNIINFSKQQMHTFKKSKRSFYFSSYTEDEDYVHKYIKNCNLKEGDIVFDCGAYCGIVTYFLSKLVGETGKVYAFEPDEANYLMLLKNIKLHNLKNVIPVKKGIWSTTGQQEFNLEGALGGCFGAINHRPFNRNIINIDTISLIDAYNMFAEGKEVFVKMDIEGAEIEVINKSKEFLKNHKVNFSIASYHMVEKEMTYKKLEKIFSEINYEYKTEGLKEKFQVGNVITYAW